MYRIQTQRILQLLVLAMDAVSDDVLFFFFANDVPVPHQSICE